MVEFKGFKACFSSYGVGRIFIYGNGILILRILYLETILELCQELPAPTSCVTVHEAWEIEALAMFLAESEVLKPFVDKIIEDGQND